MLQTIEIEEFKLKWRWTNPNYKELSQPELAQILPLASHSANEVFKEAMELRNSIKVNKSLSTEEPDNVSAWLNSLIPDEPIILSWDNETGVKTESQLFKKYWEKCGFILKRAENLTGL